MGLRKDNKIKNEMIGNNCNRNIYKNYLLGLRKTKRYINNETIYNSISNMLNSTNIFVLNYNIFENNNTNNTNIIEFNNTEVGVKNIIIGNINLDVSNVKNVYISTSKETIVLELDKKKHDNDGNNFNKYLYTGLNNIDTIVASIGFLTKIINNHN
jgi:hypothetical protein